MKIKNNIHYLYIEPLNSFYIKDMFRYMMTSGEILFLNFA